MSDSETTSRSSSVTLPKLPEGWQYHVRITGPDGSIDIEPPGVGVSRTEYTVGVHSMGREARTFTKPDLADALRGAAKAIRALNRLVRHEAEARKARQALLDEIGDGETRTAAEPSTPGPVRSTAPSDTDGDAGGDH